MIGTFFAATMILTACREVALDGNASVSRIYRELVRQRAVQLERLHAYAQAGVFPKNTDFTDRREPFFVDTYGTACAVGHLMLESGERRAVEAIAKTNNHVRVMDVHDGPLVAWVLRSGLTQEECARIQPAYEWEERDYEARERESRRIREHLAKVEDELRKATDESLATALRRLLDNAIDMGKITERDLPMLVESFKDKEPNVRLGAAFAMSRVQPKGERAKAAVEALLARLKDDDPHVQFWAAAGLVDVAPSGADIKPLQAALEMLIKALKQGNEDERAFAITRLGLLGGMEARVPGRRSALMDPIVEALAGARADKSDRVRTLAEMILRFLGGAAPEKITVKMERMGDYKERNLESVGAKFLAEYFGGGLPLEMASPDSIRKNPDSLRLRNRLGQSLLHVAAAAKRREVMEEALKLKTDLWMEDRTRDGKTVLLEAVAGGAAEVADWMIEHKADLRARDSIYGWTAAHWAAYRLPASLKNLVERGGDINVKDEQGFTPLHIAAGYETSDAVPNRIESQFAGEYVVRLLADLGADLNAKDKNGHTPLWWARKLGRKTVVDELVKCGAKE